MAKKLTAVFCGVIALSILLAAVAYFALPAPGGDTGLTVVRAAQQSAVTRPAGFPDPEANWVKLPAGANLAEGKAVNAGEVTEVYTASNATDGDTNTYWESKGFPAEITVDLAGSHQIAAVALRLNPAALWEARAQTLSVLVSADGESFTPVADEAKYEFDPDTGNRVLIEFSPVQAAYVRLRFTANSSARAAGAQAAEILVFE